MKSILLASVATVGFAGIAAAEVTWGGDAEVGYNDDFEGGVFWSVGLTVNASQELDNGVTAAFTLDVDLQDDNAGADAYDLGAVHSSDYVLSVTSDLGGLYFGDTGTAAQEHWSAGVTNMEFDGFWEADDGHDEQAVMRGEGAWNGWTFALSTMIFNSNSAAESDTGVYQIAANGEVGMFNTSFAYQAEDEDRAQGAILGVAGGFTWNNFDINLAYTSTSELNDDMTGGDSMGIEVGYDVSMFDVGVFYVANNYNDDTMEAQDNYGFNASFESNGFAGKVWYHDGWDQEIGAEGSYDMGNGLMFYAGYIDSSDDEDGKSGLTDDVTEMYVAATYDLGGGAELLASYGDAGDGYTGAGDEIGDGFEVRQGTTLAVSFDF